MKFFKNTLDIEDFFRLFPDHIANTYDKKTFKLIAEDFGLDNRVSKPQTIIQRIKDIDNPKQYILDKLNQQYAEIQSEVTNFRNELQRENIYLHGTSDELHQRLRDHYEGTLEWCYYSSDKLKHELDTRHMNRDQRLEAYMNDSDDDSWRYRKHAAKLLDLFSAGELMLGDFQNKLAYTTYVTDRLKAFNLPTKGTTNTKQTRLVKHVLARRKASLKGQSEELYARLMRFQKGQENYSDMSSELVKQRLEPYDGYLGGTLDELTRRLDRFKKKTPVVDDFPDAWIREKLEEHELATIGDRPQLLERYKIISLSEENKRLRRELRNCRRRTSHRPNKKESNGSGFYTGAVTGVVAATLLRNEQKYRLKF